MSVKLTNYIRNAMQTATFQVLEDGSYLGEIPFLKDVWSHEKILKDCRQALQEVLEEWVILELDQHHPIPAINGANLDIWEPDAQEEQSDLEDAQTAREKVKIEGTVPLKSLEDELKVVGISSKLKALGMEPRPPGVVKLKNSENQYRIRVGNYRIIYEIEDEILLILVLKVAHRQDAYKN